jgi:aerobic carbon-monoxide dehydrogenase medium subunit
VSTLPPFELHRPTTVDEATGLLDELGDDAVVYSGGTELLLVMKLGFSDYSHLVDVKRIAELHRLEASEDLLEVGAAVTHRQVERSPVVRERWPAFASMERHVGNLRVRVMGTIGGNLCFADPHSDPATFLLATGGTLVCRRGDGPARELPVEDFWEGPYRTALGPGELVTTLRLPHPGAGAGIAHEKMSLHERPAVTITCLAHVADGQVSSARVAVGSVGNRPQRALEAESALVGAAAGEIRARVSAAAEAAAAAADPVEDANGSVEYKRQLVRVLVARCARAAVERAGSA